MTQVALQNPGGLSSVEQQALSQYAAALQPLEIVDVTHTHEGYLVVRTPASVSEDEASGLYQRMAEVGTDILLETGVYILLEHS
jgi:hypothetical protein